MFNVFRRVPGAYYCFQEALHDAPLGAIDDPDSLLTVTSEITRHIRHPEMQDAYYQELFDIHSAWSGALKKPMIYDDYFNGVETVDTSSYFSALTEASPRRPVFQECRTCARIDDLKENLGGYHIHLWRNPWDQWWSYKTTDYFDTAHLLFVNAAQPPDTMMRLREKINFAPYHADALADEFKHFYAHRLKPGDNYMVFYTLWCLALLAGTRHADAMWNIDTLSTSVKKRQEALDEAAQAGFSGIDLSDCKIPQAIFSAMEQKFFESIEHDVHDTILAPCMGRESVETILDLRKCDQPATQSKGQSRSKATQTTRILHHLVRRIEEREFHRVRELRSELRTFAHNKQVAENQASTLEAALKVANEDKQTTGNQINELEAALKVVNAEKQQVATKLQNTLETTSREREQLEQAKQAAEQQLDNAERSLKTAKADNQRLEQRTKAIRAQSARDAEAHRSAVSELESKLESHRRQLDLVHSSWSWKITAPLRWIYKTLFQSH